MLGAIIGDIVGSRFEFNNHRSKEFELFGDGCFVTNDSIMTLAVAKAILETEKSIERGVGLFESDRGYINLLSELTVKYMQEIGRKYPDCGYGGMFGRWMFSNDPKPYHSFGNGAAMRVSAVGFYARDEFEIKELSRTVTAVTHDHEEGLKGAEATALVVYLARTGSLKDEIRNVINRDFYQLDFSIDEIRDSYEFNETCQETVPQAIECFLESSSFEDAIRTAISLGGDSDTIAAITGAIAEAYYGVPESIKQNALSYLDEELLGIYTEWEARACVNDNGLFWALTKYIGRFVDSDPYGEWIVDNKGNGSMENPYHFPWVNYKLPVESLIVEANQFSISHPEYRPYTEVLESNGIKWEHDEMCRANIEKMDEECLVALIVASVRAEKFCDGAVLRFLEEGCIQKWLKRLRDNDSKRLHNKKLAELYFSIGSFGMSEPYHLIFAGKRSYLLSKVSPVGFKANAEWETQRLCDVWDELHTEYWRYGYPQEGCRIVCDGTQWSLDVRYEGGFWISYSGDNNYPENWFGMLDMFGIKHSDEEDENEDVDDDTNDGQVEHVRRPGEVIYCKVSFSKNGTSYSYLTDDESISVGDSVIIPVGDDNAKRTGIVEAIDFYLPEDVPYPLDKVKQIIRKVLVQNKIQCENGLNDDVESPVHKHSNEGNNPPVQDNITTDVNDFFCPVYNGMITQYDCDEISCGAKHGYIFNDGLPLLMDITTIKSKREICFNCERYESTTKNRDIDNSLREEFDKEDRIKVSDIVDYRVWLDDHNSAIGIIVDFETADDFHYQLLTEAWERFLIEVLDITDTAEVTSALRDFFKTNTGLFDFEEALNSHGIKYIKNAYY